MTMPAQTSIDPTLSVNEIIRQWPAAIRVLNACGVDTCCGGAAPLSEAADEAGVPVSELQRRIAEAVAEEATA